LRGRIKVGVFPISSPSPLFFSPLSEGEGFLPAPACRQAGAGRKKGVLLL